MRFSSIIGHKRVLSFFDEEIKEDRVKGIYLFKGPVGVGKKQIARLVSKYLICESIKEDSCTCFTCRNFSSYLAYLEIDKGEEAILIEDIDKIWDLISLLPNKRKAVVINNAHNLNLNSSNKLLKLFESLPSRLVVFLISHNPDLIIDPLVSRCNLVTFSSLKEKEICEVLNKIGVEDIDHDLVRMSYFFGKSLFECYEMYKKYKDEMDNFFNLIVDKKVTEILLKIKEIDLEKGIDFFIDLLLVFLNDILKVKIGGERRKEIIEKLSKKITVEDCIYLINKIEEAQKVLKRKINLNSYQYYLPTLLWLFYFFLEDKERK